MIYTNWEHQVENQNQRLQSFNVDKYDLNDLNDLNTKKLFNELLFK